MSYETRRSRINLFLICFVGCAVVFHLIRISTNVSSKRVNLLIPTFNTSYSGISKTLIYKESIRRPRIASILTVSPSKRYLFVLPFVVAAWQKLGVEPIVIVVGDPDKLQKQHQAKLTIEILIELGAQVHFIQNETTTAPTLSQTSRLFAAAMPFSKDFSADDIFITTDADMIPFHLKNHIPNLLAAQKAYLYNADCISPIAVPPARGHHKVPQYPMSTIAATVSTWREIMGFSSTDFDGTSIESYLKVEFGQDFFHPNDGDKRKLVQHGLIWYADQSLVSYKIHEWFKSNPDNRAATTLTRGGCYPRIDRIKWPNPKDMPKQNLNLLGDAHVLEDGFINDQWERFRPLIDLVFKGDQYALLRERFDQYRSDYIAQDCC
uniref:Glycosyltransferase family 8 protein n=1 Tax=Panagrellus redivivus TaxID=6233 RepID=A0A7E4W092_PANRE